MIAFLCKLAIAPTMMEYDVEEQSNIGLISSLCILLGCGTQILNTTLNALTEAPSCVY